MSKKPKDGSKEILLSKSKKTEAVEILFERFWPKGAAQPTQRPMIATNDDVVSAISERNKRHPGEAKPLSTKNPANFLKDLIRKSSCNTNWPDALKKLRVTARQRYGATQVLEFVDYREGDTVPFPDRYEPVDGVSTIKVEALSLPRAARALGRVDEAWLTQVVVYQRIIHHHLAAISKKNVVELTHLQMSVKTQPEIDAIFVATIDESGDDLRVLVTCEAKQYGERILEDQVREQVAQAFVATRKLKDAGRIDAVMPMVVKVVNYLVPGVGRRRGIYVVEFDMMSRSSFDKSYSERLHDMPLTLMTSAFYYLQPSVRGISDSTTIVASLSSEEPDDDSD